MDRYFCTVEITYPKKGYFSYSSAKTLPFHLRNKIIKGISDPIKTEATEQVLILNMLDLATVLKRKVSQ